MTRSATVTLAASADCPVWLAFLERIMGADQAMIDYLQRASGYMLTGLVSEHVLFFAHGTGANGKSTFADVLLGILGTGPTGYATVAPMSTFTAAVSDQHPTDLAGLRGMRCVVAHETEEGRSWAVAKIKMMTGGDMITARFMRQDFFTYAPQFKVLILGNHRPSLHGVDEATRRRMHLIPFDVTIPVEERDKALPDKLRAEYPGILRWMIFGCLAWQAQGLQPPARVVAATNEYFADEDTFSAWLTECCAMAGDCKETLQTLFTSWQSWCEANGEYAGTRRRLGQRLAAHGLKRAPEGKANTSTGTESRFGQPPGAVRDPLRYRKGRVERVFQAVISVTRARARVTPIMGIPTRSTRLFGAVSNPHTPRRPMPPSGACLRPAVSGHFNQRNHHG